MFNKVIVIIICVVVLVFGCRGIAYPKLIFSIKQLGDVPPTSADERLELKDNYPREIDLYFRRPGNEFNYSLFFMIFVKKKYNNLRINKLKYTWSGGEGLLMSDVDFKLPRGVSKTGDDPNLYYGKDGYYWTFLRKPIEANNMSLLVDLQKVFNEVSIGDRFNFKIEIDYTFDDEPMRSDFIDYEAYVMKGKYTSKYAGY